ncbi:MAG: sodium:proton antiporter [Planctomycetales bacterium]|nr:sodium:proton antiporter [Planctomycetales bacterium]
MATGQVVLLQLVAVILLGVGAQWLAWRLRLPSIVLLLGFGLLAGPGLRWAVPALAAPDSLAHPENVLGVALFPLTSLAVGIILFEGALSLRLSREEATQGAVLRLITVGAAVTWLVTTALAHFLLGLEARVACLLGAILVVSGPTVVLPILRDVRPSGRVGQIARWEGIVVDPVGAVLAVLVFEALFFSAGEAVGATAIAGLIKTIVAGTGLALVGAWALVELLKRHLIPDHLLSPMTLMFAVVVFGASNVLQHESGLLAVTVMGAVLANQNRVPIKRIIQFKEDLSILLVSALFIVLAARLKVDDLRALDWRSLVFIVALILVVRPLAVWLCTIGGGINRAERMFLAWLAPRGIVAAAVSAIFAIRLEELGHPQANLLVPLTFLVIISTVVVYGTTISTVARRLGLSDRDPQGFLILGAHRWARAIAEALKHEDLKVVLVDANRQNVVEARLQGLAAHHGNVLADNTLDELDLGGVGRMLALTANDEVNTLAVIQARDIFERVDLYQLVSQPESARRKRGVAREFHGRWLFAPEATYTNLAKRHAQGGTIKCTSLTAEFDFAAYRARYGDGVLPLMAIDEEGHVRVATVETPLAFQPGDRLVAFVPPESEWPEQLPNVAKQQPDDNANEDIKPNTGDTPTTANEAKADG